MSIYLRDRRSPCSHDWVVADAVRANRSARASSLADGKPLGDLTALPPDPAKLSTICLTHKSGIRLIFMQGMRILRPGGTGSGLASAAKLPLTYSNSKLFFYI